MIFTCLQIFGILCSRIILVKRSASQVSALGPRRFRNSWWTRSYPGQWAVPRFIRPKALTTLPGEIALGRGSDAKFWRAWCHPSHTLFSKVLFAGALMTWTRWNATLFAETGGLADWGGRWAAPTRQRRAQLFRLEWVKFILAVDSSYLARLAASKVWVWWSAVSESSDFSHSSSNAWASLIFAFYILNVRHISTSGLFDLLT